MNTATFPYHDYPLDKLVAEHASMRKLLGPNHVLVQEIWDEIKKRQPGSEDSATLEMQEI